MSKEKNRQTLGKNLSLGSIVRLSGLTSAKGQKMNEAVAEIVGGHREGRFNIRLLEGSPKSDSNSNSEAIRIKTLNMRVVCSNCFKDQKKLQYCALCHIACYCSKECQSQHWKCAGPRQHKVHCTGKTKNAIRSSMGSDDKQYLQGLEEDLRKEWYKKIMKTTNETWNGKEINHSPKIIWKKSMDHPSWSNLTQPMRHSLRKHHEISGCAFPWPVSVETPAMLDDIPCFLSAHPNSEYSLEYIKLPAGGGAPILCEKVPAFSEEKGEWPYSRVPFHTPMPMKFAIIGEVIWMKKDYDVFKNYYDKPGMKGAFFDWPGAEVIAVCPGTGKRVKHSRSKKHLLVVCNMHGQVVRGEFHNILTRLMPRILTIEGYYKMLGKDKKDRCINIDETMSTTSAFHDEGWWNGTDEFYPKQLEKINVTRGLSEKWPGMPIMASSHAFSLYNSSGEYHRYEGYMKAHYSKRAKMCADIRSADHATLANKLKEDNPSL